MPKPHEDVALLCLLLRDRIKNLLLILSEFKRTQASFPPEIIRKPRKPTLF